VLNSVLWTFLGFLLTGIALWRASGFRDQRARSHGFDHESSIDLALQPTPKEMRLIIQIRVILEILISCFSDRMR